MENLFKDKAYKIRVVLLLLADILIIQCASFFSLYIRYDFKMNDIDPLFLKSILLYAPINTLFVILVFILFKLYSSIWMFASVNEMLNIIMASIVCFFAEILEMILTDFRVPRSHPFIFFVFLVSGTICIRFGYRFLRYLKYDVIENKKGESTMIIGGGQAAAMLIKEIRTSEYAKYNIKCIIDDDERKIGKYVSGIKVFGNREKILDAYNEYNIKQIIVAMPSANIKSIKEILEICKETDCKLKKIPGIYQLINGSVSVDDIKNVEIEDLLGREPIKVGLDTIMEYVENKCVLVTGGGGSIGSELCRQLAIYNPKKLIVVDIYENNAYDIEQELITLYPDLDVEILIASVRNEERLESIFKEYKPDIVYHAAAHKHVPLMEKSPNESIKNNVFGTYKVSELAGKYNVKKLVLISTDKAVNPTNIMGASKRICEMIVQMMNSVYKDTEYVAVRFGNVLGSNGSVIPLFKKQIEKGGPVTVTHPDIIRYFMTIPEAVSLVLQAGAYAKGGEIFVLDMGEPVKILDLAKNLIRLSGYTENDIDIEFTGLRPGEKLYEELLISDKNLKRTENKLIYIENSTEFDLVEFKKNLMELEKECQSESKDIRAIVKKIVKNYSYSE